jgi:threonine dehydrogenase-like Zn-dependent dehydrogenase
MKALVFKNIGDIRVEDVADPKIEKPTDAIVRLTASAICGTDLHMVRGTMPDMVPGTILGHEGVGVVEEVGNEVRNFKPGDRVVVCATIACGYCPYCRDGFFAQCDNANPNGSAAGTAFFGGPKSSGPFHGLQAEKARIPFASVNLLKLPNEITDEQAIMLADIFPTAYFGAEMAEIRPGDTVAIFGCGPVGQFAIASAKLMGAGRIFAIDCIPSRLEMARNQGAEIINYDVEDPVEILKKLTGGNGADRVIDCVGVDSNHAHHGPAAGQADKLEEEFKRELEYNAKGAKPKGDNWHPGDAPTQALRWEIDAVSKAGTVSIIGVYPETLMVFPIGKAMNKNLTIRMGNCNHRKYIPHLIELVRVGAVDPSDVLTQHGPIASALEAYQAFDTRKQGWIKVKLEPQEKKVA